MKKLVIAVSLLTLAACTKSSSSSSSNTTSNDYPNTITVTDAGKAYTLNGGTPSLGALGAGVTCYLTKGGTGISSITFGGMGTGINLSNPYPVQVDIISGYAGPATGIGNFNASDKTASGLLGNITETYSGGQTYEIDTMNVNVTQCSGTTVVGTFWLHVVNSAASKTVTGSFNCPKSSIQ